MSLKERLQADIKDCMRSRDKKKISVLRMILSEIQYAETSADAAGALDETKSLKIIATYEKRLVKALSDFPDGDKKDELHYEIGIVGAYLPKKASKEEMLSAIDQVLSDSNEQNFGVVMKQVMAKFGAAADGKALSGLIKERLAAKN